MPGVAGLSGLGSLVLLVWSLVLLVSTASSPSHQGVHDRVAASVVVQRAGTSNTGWIVGCIAVLVVLGLLAILSIVALVFLGGQVSRILSTVGESI